MGDVGVSLDQRSRQQCRYPATHRSDRRRRLGKNTFRDRDQPGRSDTSDTAFLSAFCTERNIGVHERYVRPFFYSTCECTGLLRDQGGASFLYVVVEMAAKGESHTRG